jgi:hypothetical protein
MPPLVSSDAPKVEAAAGRVVGPCPEVLAWPSAGAVQVAARLEAPTSVDAPAGGSGVTVGEAGGASGTESSATVTGAWVGFFALQL